MFEPGRYLDLIRCRRCDCLFYPERLQNKGEGPNTHYTSFSRPCLKFYLEVGAGLHNYARILSRAAKAVTANGRPIRCLEIGCGFGFGVHMAATLGWECRGVDPSPAAAEGRRILGIDLEQRFFDPATLPRGGYDVVVAVEVIEHLQEPLAFLRELVRATSPYGLVCLTTPNADVAIEDDERASALSPGEHVVLFSEQAMRKAFVCAGLRHASIFADGGSTGKKTLLAIGSPRNRLAEADAALGWNEAAAQLLLRYLEHAAKVSRDPWMRGGMLHRLVEERTNRGEYPRALEAAARLLAHMRETYGTDDMIALADRSLKAAGNFDAYVMTSPCYLSRFLYYSGMLALNATGDPEKAAACFSASVRLIESENHLPFFVSGFLLQLAKQHEALARTRC